MFQMGNNILAFGSETNSATSKPGTQSSEHQPVVHKSYSTAGFHVHNNGFKILTNSDTITTGSLASEPISGEL